MLLEQSRFLTFGLSPSQRNYFGLSMIILSHYLLLIVSIINWTTTRANKLKKHELVIRGSDFKLEIDRSNFTKCVETIATHAEQMFFESLFTYGPADNDVPHPIHDLFATETYVLTNYGVISLIQVKAFANSIHDGDSDLPKYKDKCWYKYLLNACNDKMKKHTSQQIIYHRRSGIITLKIVINKATKADREHVRLAKSEL